jgi:capsular exopolysaccharide synthesis family protein
MITSSLPGEGKTSTSIMLAQSWASSGKRVLLVDCDLRLGSLKRQFKITTEAGLITVLSGNVPFEEAVHHDRDTGIDILIAGSTKVTGVDVFGSKSFEAFMKKMRATYDYIILDSPPVLAVPDARVIAQNADAVIHLVHWNATSRRLIRSGLASLFQVNVRVSGLALTRVNAKRMDRYGYYGSGYGGTATSKYYSN